MSFSKRAREEAARLCAIAASNGRWSISNAAYEVESDHDARTLALSAQAEACRRMGSWVNYGDTYAEAEAMLRTGWTP